MFFLTLILFAGFTLRLWNLGTQSLWHDEAWSVFSAYHPLTWGAQGTDPNSPPMFYLLLGLWQHLAGDSVWAMRYLSLLIGLITVAVTARIVRQWFGRSAALLAAFFVAISPILWVFSQEIRAYIAMPLLALILLVLTDYLLRKPHDSRPWRLLFVAELITLYTHNLSVPLIAWLNVVVFAAFAWRHDLRNLVRWFAVQIVAGLLYLPWLLTQRPTGTPLNTPPSLDLLFTSMNIFDSYFSGVKALLDSGEIGLWTMPFVLLLLAAIVEAFRRFRSRKIFLVSSQAILLPALSLMELYAAHIDFHPRYFILGVPTFLILSALGISAFWKSNFVVLKGLGAISFFGIMLLSIHAIRLVTTVPTFQHDDFRAIAEHYTMLSANDAILIPYGWEPTLAYYLSKMDVKAQVVGIPLGSSIETAIKTLNANRYHQLELLTWYQLPADLRGMYSCLLGAASEAEPNALTVNGLTTARYIDPMPIDLRPLKIGKVVYSTFEPQTISMSANGQRACVVTDWQLKQNTHLNYRVALNLLNPLGNEFVKSDADLRNDRQLSTAFVSAGQRVQAFNLFTFPVGTPSGEYPFVAELYRPANPYHSDVLIYDYRKGGALSTFAIAPIDVSTIPDKNPVSLSDSLQYLVQDMPVVSSLRQGIPYSVDILWLNGDSASDNLPKLRLRGKDWQIEMPSNLQPNRHTMLNWYQFTVKGQKEGDADLELVMNDGKTHLLKRFTVEPSTNVFALPAISTPISASFEGLGDLLGFDFSGNELQRSTPFNIKLYWQPTRTTNVNYKVFVHLLDSNGQVLAQSDSQPANGERPTTSWLAGEYITDPHTLTWNRADYKGAVTLEVGLYNAETGERVKLADGSDHFILPITINVK